MSIFEETKISSHIYANYKQNFEILVRQILLALFPYNQWSKKDRTKAKKNEEYSTLTFSLGCSFLDGIVESEKFNWTDRQEAQGGIGMSDLITLIGFTA